jgi:hypothetical protein
MQLKPNEKVWTPSGLAFAILIPPGGAEPKEVMHFLNLRRILLNRLLEEADARAVAEANDLLTRGLPEEMLLALPEELLGTPETLDQLTELAWDLRCLGAPIHQWAEKAQKLLSKPAKNRRSPADLELELKEYGLCRALIDMGIQAA